MQKDFFPSAVVRCEAIHPKQESDYAFTKNSLMI